MAFNIQRNSRNLDKALYQFGLIKILVEEKKLRSDNWEPCLVINYFIEALEEKKNCPKRKGRRGRVFSNPYPQEENKEAKETLVERGH